MALASVPIQLDRWTDNRERKDSSREVLQTEVHWVPGKASRRESRVRIEWEEEKQDNISTS